MIRLLYRGENMSYQQDISCLYILYKIVIVEVCQDFGKLCGNYKEYKKSILDEYFFS